MCDSPSSFKLCDLCPRISECDLCKIVMCNDVGGEEKTFFFVIYSNDQDPLITLMMMKDYGRIIITGRVCVVFLR